MKKCIIIAVLAAILTSAISGVVFYNIGADKPPVTVVEEKPGFIQAESINGYERAVFDKFNSPASENGLDGTKIYIDGYIHYIDDLDGCYVAPLKTDDGEWCVTIGTKEIGTDEFECGDLCKRNVRIFGTYMGFSGVYQKPAMMGLYYTDIDTGESFSLAGFTTLGMEFNEGIMEGLE